MKKISGVTIAFGLLFYSGTALAAKLIDSPYVEKGSKSVEMHSAYRVDEDSEEDDSYDLEASFGYGVTDFWLSEMGIAFEDPGKGEKLDAQALVLENTFALAKPGQFFVDPGVKIEYERSLLGEADTLGAKLLLAKQLGLFSNLVNFGVEREVGKKSSDDNAYSFAYSIAYEQSEHLSYGLEWYSDFADFDHGFDEQSHQLGPVLYGELGGVGIEAGVLAGISDAAPDAEFKLNVAYEF